MKTKPLCDYISSCTAQEAFLEKTDTYQLRGNCCYFCGEDLSIYLDEEETEHHAVDKYGIAVNPKESMN